VNVCVFVRRITCPLDDIISCSFSSFSEHQGNYANIRIAWTSKKANFSQGLSSFLSFVRSFFSIRRIVPDWIFPFFLSVSLSCA
jgi:hypothetical protein